MSDASQSEDEYVPPDETLESLFDGSDSDDDVAPPAPAEEEDDDQLSVADLVREPEQLAEPVPATLPAEPDGHVNVDGILYREPRRPFTGTLWDALRNAFIRIDVDNRRLPTGGRPQGYIWVPSINGFRRTLAQTLLDEQRLAEQLRNAQQPRRSGQAQELFGPDVPNATLLEISWYVSACGHHVPWGWFNLVANAFKSAVDKTGDRGQLLMAYERGERKELGHLQGIARLLTHESFKDKLRRWLRAALLLSTGMYRAKIGLVFFTGQEWEHMGGYVQKDAGKAHYRFYAYPDMSESDLATMRDAYKKQSDCLSFNKLTLTPRNIRNEMFKFYREHLHPLEAPSFRHTLQWALQTDKYVLNWQFDFGTQLNLAAVEATWRLALDSSAAKDIAIVEAAAFVPEKRGVAPGSWADDNYTGLSFDQVCMTAMDVREDLNNERMQRTMDDEHAADEPAPFDYSTTGDSTALDLGDLAAQLHDIASRQPDDDAEPDGFELPEYAAAAAQDEEENGTSMSDDEATSADADRREAERRAARGRWVLDEAEEA